MENEEITPDQPESVVPEIESTPEVEATEEEKSSSRRLIAIVAAAVLLVAAVGVTLAFTVFKSKDMAAQVGKLIVTNKDVTTSVNEILAERKGVDTTGMQIATGNQLTLAELNFHLISYLLADTAASKNVVVTDAQVAKRKADIITQIGSAAQLPSALVAANIASEDLDLYIRSLLYDEQLASDLEKSGTSQANAGTALEQEVSQEAVKVGIKVNAKYGTWDPTQAVVVAPATPTPTPSK